MNPLTLKTKKWGNNQVSRRFGIQNKQTQSRQIELFYVRNQMFFIAFLEHQLLDTKNVNRPKNSNVEKKKVKVSKKGKNE